MALNGPYRADVPLRKLLTHLN